MDQTALLTAVELATKIGVRPDTVKLWARKGMIPAIRISPKVIRFDLSAVLAALQARPDSRGGGR